MCVYIICNTQIVRLYIYSYGIIYIITQIYLRHLFYGTSVSQGILATFIGNSSCKSVFNHQLWWWVWSIRTDWTSLKMLRTPCSILWFSHHHPPSWPVAKDWILATQHASIRIQNALRSAHVYIKKHMVQFNLVIYGPHRTMVSHISLMI